MVDNVMVLLWVISLFVVKLVWLFKFMLVMNVNASDDSDRSKDICLLGKLLKYCFILFIIFSTMFICYIVFIR